MSIHRIPASLDPAREAELLADEISNAGSIQSPTPLPSDPPSTWDSYLTARDESVLLDAGFEYGFHMSTMWGYDREGKGWVANIKDEGGGWGEIEFFEVVQGRGTTVRYGPMYSHEFNKRFLGR